MTGKDQRNCPRGQLARLKNYDAFFVIPEFAAVFIDALVVEGQSSFGCWNFFFVSHKHPSCFSRFFERPDLAHESCGFLGRTKHVIELFHSAFEIRIRMPPHRGAAFILLFASLMPPLPERVGACILRKDADLHSICFCGKRLCQVGPKRREFALGRGKIRVIGHDVYSIPIQSKSRQGPKTQSQYGEKGGRKTWAS